MKNQTRKIISFLLVLVQLFVLFPVLQPQAKAAAQSESETPALNETIVGTVKFQSFNLLGSNSNNRDEYYEGVDYTSTFYYSDDYFAGSAANPAMENTATAKHEWHELENQPLAALSAAFAFASFTSNEGNCVTPGGYSWNNTNYANKDSNAKSFFQQCGFASSGTKYQQYELLKAPGMDTIGCVISSKSIRVWDPASGTNKPYTLVAVGVRGAGYGAEWANNITIGNPNNNTHDMINGRHWGFETSAQTVCDRVYNYLTENNISGDVKYWVTGFSRAGAVANLVAGKLTDNAGHDFGGSKDNVFGYTWECPQAASVNDPALFYTNIHNILNPMDAVPKVSPDEFEHQRLGIDYRMPYYGNTDAAQNTEYYSRMYETLKTIAVGTTINGTFKEDELIQAVNPSNYPYNRALPLYTIDFWQLIQDAAGNNLKKNFGTTAYTGSGKIGGGNFMLDQYIDSLIDVFLTSPAWTNASSSVLVDPITNRTAFLQNYQKDFRTLFGYLLDYSGPAFMDMLDKMIAAVQKEFGIEFSISAIFNLLDSAPLAVAFYEFYTEPNSSYGSGIFSFWPSSWKGKTHKQVLITEAQSKVVDIVNSMTSGYNNSSISRTQMNNALRNLTGVVVNLYAVELDQFHSQYFGTTLHWLNEILSTHEQETVLSWIMSLDENHMNRSCRTITIPAGCDATVYEYREQYAQYEGSMDDVEAKAPVVAELENGALDSVDDRITLYQENGSYVIRYPASLQIRVDVKPNQTINLNSIAVDDYETRNAYTAVSDGVSQFQNKPLYNTYSTITQQPGKTNAAAKNTALSGYGTIGKGDTLHVIVNDMQSYNSGDTVYELLVDKAPETTVVDYGAASAGLATGTDAAGAVRLGVDTTVSTSTDSSRSIPTRQTQITVPASSVYFDDELQSGDASDYTGETARLDSDTESKTFWYQFRGTRIDVYCTTSSITGYVQAAVTDADGNVVTVNGDRKIVTMKSASDTTRYNVPTISFDGLDSNTDYYLKITALKGSNYRLDGIRVYHAADESNSAVQAAYEAAGEQNANYVNLRALLLGSVTESTLQDKNVAGALFYTDSGTSYTLASDEYLANSPKNEIYLKSAEKVAFQIVGTYEKVAVGLSAPESKTGGGSVTVTDGSGFKTIQITDALDQYYDITPAPDGSVIITNSGFAVIAITNVKLSGEYTPPAVTESVGPLVVSRGLLHYAADFAQLPSADDPTPTPDFGELIQQLISSFVESLFSSISRLFG